MEKHFVHTLLLFVIVHLRIAAQFNASVSLQGEKESHPLNAATVTEPNAFHSVSFTREPSDTSSEEYSWMVESLEKNLDDVKEFIEADNDYDFSFAAGSLKLAQQKLNNLKSKYPNASTSKYEAEMKRLDGLINARASKIESKEDAITTVRQLAFDCEAVIPETYSVSMFTQFRTDAERFYEKCTHANYPGAKKKIDALLAQYPDMKEDPEVKSYIDDFYHKLIPEFTPFGEFLVKCANQAMESSYSSLQRKDMLAANDNAAISRMLTQCVLLYLPEHAAAKRLLIENDKLSTKLDAAMGNVYSSPYHKANAGTIILSTSPITTGKETASTSINSFTLKDHIYAMAYLKGTVKELCDGAAMGQTTMMVTLFIDGNEMGSFEYPMTKNIQQSTWVPLEILPDPDKSIDCAGSVKYATILSQCSPREHEVSFRFSAVYLSSRHDLATGKVQIDCSEGQDAVAKLVTVYRSRALKNVYMPKPAMSNPALEAEMIAATRVMLSRRGLQGTPIKAVIIEDGWTVYRHPISGIIVERKINGTVSVKKPNGECVMYEQTFSQAYAGGKYGNTQPASTDDGTALDCGNAGAK